MTDIKDQVATATDISLEDAIKEFGNQNLPTPNADDINKGVDDPKKTPEGVDDTNKGNDDANAKPAEPKSDNTDLNKGDENNPPSGDEEKTLVEDMILRTGFEVLDAEGNKVTYEDTEAGLANYIKDAVSINAEALANQQQLKFFEANPDIYRLVQYKQLYGTIDGFNETVDYATIQFDNKNVELMFNLVVDDLIEQGMNEQQARDFASFKKESNKLEEASKLAHSNLINRQKATMAERDNKLKAKMEEERESHNAYWNETINTIQKGNLDGYIIPTNKQTDFFNFIYQAVDADGNTKADLAVAKLSNTRKLANLWEIYNNYDRKSLITEMIKVDKAEGLKSRLNRQNQNLGKGANVNVTTSKLSNMSIDQIFDNIVESNKDNKNK